MKKPSTAWKESRKRKVTLENEYILVVCLLYHC
jgi:hypothetical protein